MGLTHRPTTPQDLDACLPLIRNGFAFGADDRPPLLALWRHLLDGGLAESAVVEEADGPAGRRVVGFGLSVFVTDEFAQEARTRLPPVLAPQVLSRWRQGRPPFLDAAQIRRANSGAGLHCLILHNGWAGGGPAEEAPPAIRHKLIEAFFASHCGYRLRCFLHESYGAAERDKMLAFGWHQERDHPGRAALLCIRREDALESVFHPFYGLFQYSPAQMFFRPAEQALLGRALRGEGDGEIAQGLGIALATVHKRWRAVFERASECDPTLLPPAAEACRGAEKRTRLLRHLQQHPEELRPLIRPPRAGRGGPGGPRRPPPASARR